MTHVIRRLKHEGADALEIGTHQQISSPKGVVNLKDVYLVRSRDLRPIAYTSSTGGKTTVQLRYEDGRVVGTKEVKGETVSVDQTLTGPVWDGGLWGSLMASLPLKMNGTYRLPFYHYSSGLGDFNFTVVGEQMVETPRGSERAWVIDAYKDPARMARYYISKKSRQELGYVAMGIAQSLASTCPSPA
jgi:hypothetical protein